MLRLNKAQAILEDTDDAITLRSCGSEKKTNTVTVFQQWPWAPNMGSRDSKRHQSSSSFFP